MLHKILLGYNTEAISNVGPKHAREMLRHEWTRADSIGLIRLVRLVICLTIFLLPTIYIDLLVPRKSKAAIAVARELYYICVLVFLGIALFRDWHRSNIVIALVIYFLAGALVHLSGQVFVWGQQSIDAARSLLLALINYAEMTIGFAILYRYWDCLSIQCLSIQQPSALTALYFSIVTAATVGYGDIVSACTNPGRWLVIAQIGTAFLFVAVIIAALLGRATASVPSSSSINK